MDILLVVRDCLMRDQIKVGLQQFEDFTVTTGEGYSAINDLRQVHYDCVFLEIDPRDQEGRRLFSHLRSFDRTTEVVVVTVPRHAKELAGEKTKMNIVSFLHRPINVTDFFRLVGRLRSRSDPSRSQEVASADERVL
jgi:DNA-binding NtrC family response regulator